MERACGKCVYWSGELSECRRYPPKFVGNVSMFPTTVAEDWCGEFKVEQSKKKQKTLDAPDGVSAEVWSDWLALRKAKGAEVTPTAMAGIRSEADKAGMSLEEALRTCCERGWRGFKAEWVGRNADSVSAIVMRQLEAEGRG